MKRANAQGESSTPLRWTSATHQRAMPRDTRPGQKEDCTPHFRTTGASPIAVPDLSFCPCLLRPAGSGAGPLSLQGRSNQDPKLHGPVTSSTAWICSAGREEVAHAILTEVEDWLTEAVCGRTHHGGGGGNWWCLFQENRKFRNRTVYLRSYESEGIKIDKVYEPLFQQGYPTETWGLFCKAGGLG